MATQGPAPGRMYEGKNESHRTHQTSRENNEKKNRPPKDLKKSTQGSCNAPRLQVLSTVFLIQTNVSLNVFQSESVKMCSK